METGIGSLSNADIERTLRYSINRDGHLIPPFMNYSDLSKNDMLAIVSYLRAQPPVKNETAPMSLNVLGKGATRFMLKPLESTGPIQEEVLPEISVKYGEYLVNNVAGCTSCHTPFDMGSMSWNKDLMLAGGTVSETDDYIFYPPNLTPDPKTGHIYDWTEGSFVRRFKNGKVYESMMPWDQYKEMTEDDLKSIYLYLQSIPAIENDPGPHITVKTETD